MALADGLLVPVIRHVETLSFVALGRAVKSVSRRAHCRRLPRWRRLPLRLRLKKC
ncbi:2-oxo acid dehydrogenase subunit E2 [Alicyclobacillus kakegawensis]|uniref:2-oxo acid dehydrogenase subunit E2 n=1 Tax=Alicyclobacillus kakegawensis TaxID=392012 RepID=UPI0034E30247